MFIKKSEYEKLKSETNNLHREIANYQINRIELIKKIKLLEEDNQYQSNRIKRSKRHLHNTTTALNAANESIKAQKDLLNQEALLNKILKIKIEDLESKLDNYPKMNNRLQDSNLENNRLKSIINETKEYIKNQKDMYNFSKYSLYRPENIIAILDEVSSILD